MVSVPKERPLTILLATMAPFVSGAEIAGERLALGLVEQGHRVVVAVGTDGDALIRYRKAGLNAVYAPMRHTSKWGWWRYYLARRNLRRLFRHVNPDVIHSNDLQTHQIVSNAARGLGVPRVCHHRFIFPGPALDWLNKFGGELHVAISRAVREELCGQSPTLAASRWVTVHDGIPIPPAPSDADRIAARQMLGLSPDVPVVLFAGQVIELKGVADLLQAWALVTPELRSRGELVVVGEDRQSGGRYLEAMRQLAGELGIRVRFTGFVTDVGMWQTAATVAVVPSHLEPLGLVSLEAMARRVPVVGTAVGGIPEVILDGETGLLVPPKSPPELAAALTRLLHDPDLCSRLGHAGRQRCEDVFGIDTHVRNILTAYHSTLALSPTPRPG
jgi:glycosyltransferase involved in cell wall biosynthesis